MIEQLKDSFDATSDVDQLHEIHNLREGIVTHCDSSEDRIKITIKGELAAISPPPAFPVPPPPPRIPPHPVATACRRVNSLSTLSRMCKSTVSTQSC